MTFRLHCSPALLCSLLIIAACRTALLSEATPQAHGEDFPTVKNSKSEDHLSPMPAKEAAAKMKLPPGFRATVFASEPQVRNPIGMAWDQNGRLWVAENYTYSDRSQRFDLSLRDRVLIFEDLDNDGRADSRKVFTDKVQMLTSVEVGRGGVWLMCPPRLLFIPDANRDDIPDGPAQVMLDGFTVARSNYHNFANGLRWGPDGWLYGRCGHSCPGKLGAPGAPEADRVPIDGGIWRFHPTKKIVEVLCHGTVNPWGHDWDSNGELFFINTVIGHLWHAIPGSHFKESFGESMNPAVYERMDTIADHRHFAVRGRRDSKTNDLGGGHAHIGAVIYQGSHWPEKYHGKLLTLNMHGRRANMERLERKGSGYLGRHEPDFFMAADPFFRGIDLSTGPDGNVFVIDWSDTGECHEHTGVHRLSGRIFKISYGKSCTPKSIYKPAGLGGKGPLHKLWADYQAGRATAASLRKLENAPNEHVRVWAIRLLTDFWPLDRITGPGENAVYPNEPKTRAMLMRMARQDQSGLVHRVLASTLQRLPVKHRTGLAVELVKHQKYAADHEMALLLWYGVSPLGEKYPDSLVALARQCRWPLVVRFIARNLSERLKSEPKPLNQLLAAANRMSKDLQTNVLLGIQDALRGWRKAPKPKAWDAFIRNSSLSESTVVRELSSLFGDGRALADVRRIALDKRTEMQARQSALRTLIEARPKDLRQVCESLLDVRFLNATAARGLALFEDPAVARLLVRKYRRFHPEDRPRVIAELVSRPKFTAVLLEELASDKTRIPLADITAVHARQIQSHGNEALSRKLKAVWGEVRQSPAERLELIKKLKQQLPPESLRKADLGKGRVLFNRTCMQCHRLYGVGEQTAPDLTGSQRSNLDYLVGNLVDPGAVVSKDYRMSILRLADGRVLNGLVVSRNRQKVIVQTATERRTLAAEDVEKITMTSMSAMPNGLLQNLSTNQIRDLIAYLQHPVQVPLPEEQKK